MLIISWIDNVSPAWLPYVEMVWQDRDHLAMTNNERGVVKELKGN